MSADPALMAEIEGIVKDYFAKAGVEAFVDVSESGIRDNIHVVVMSRKFNDMTEQQKQEYLWGIIDESGLSDEKKLRISMILPLSPNDVK